VRDADTVARIGGDEFAIVLNEIKAPADAGQVAEKIISHFVVPMSTYDARTYQIGVSIGIAIYPESGADIDRLVKGADNAMYASKAAGKNRFTYCAEHKAERPSADSRFGFVDAYRVGFDVIDEQHQAMGDMLEQLNAALALQEPADVLIKQFDELVAYAGFHFQTEEQLMEQYHYPDASAHRDEHQRLVGEAKYLKARFMEGGELLVLQWIKDWLIGHISGSDRRLSEYLLKIGAK
jgi:hemerythrin-like metal-binding protein